MEKLWYTTNQRPIKGGGKTSFGTPNVYRKLKKNIQMMQTKKNVI